MADRDAVQILWQASVGVFTVQVFRVLEEVPSILYRWLLSFWQTVVGLLLGLSRYWRRDNGPFCNLNCPPWSGCYLTHQDIKLGMHTNTLQIEVVSMWSGLSRPKCTSKLHEVAQMSNVPTYGILPYLSQLASKALWGVSYKQLKGEKENIYIISLLLYS